MGETTFVLYGQHKRLADWLSGQSANGFITLIIDEGKNQCPPKHGVQYQLE